MASDETTAPTTDDASTGAVADATRPDTAADGTAPRRRRAAKAAAPRSRRTASAPAAEVVETIGTAETAEAIDATEPRGAVQVAEAAEAPAPARTRKRAANSAAGAQTTAKKAAKKATTRGTKKAAARHVAVADSPDAVLDPSDDVADSALVVDAAAPDEATEPTEATEADQDAGIDADLEASSSDTLVPPLGFGLIFQAPDTTVRRSRRATAPVSAPAPVIEVTSSVAPEDAEEVDEPVEAIEDDQDNATAEASETGADAGEGTAAGRRRRRGGRGRRARSVSEADSDAPESQASDDEGAEATVDDEGAGESADEGATSRRRRRRRRGGAGTGEGDDPPGTVTRVREPRSTRDEPTAVRGSTRLEAKKQRRREGREAGRRRTIITEAEFLARRESVERVMVVRGSADRTQIAVLEDGVLVEHYVSREQATTMVGNVYLGRVQNVLPSMEAAFVDIGKGRNAVLYAGEVNWDAAGLEVNQAKRIENALTSGDTVLVQVTKDPIGHKGARLTSQISLPGRFLVYVPEGSMTGISRKLPDTERARLKGILKEIVPDSAGVIVRTAAEGASEEELRADVERLTKAWDKISQKAESVSAKKAGSGGAPALVHGEPDLTVRVIRDIFTEDFAQLVVSGERAWEDVSDYVEGVARDLAPRLSRWTSETDVFTHHRVQEQLAKAMDRKVWLPSGGSLVIDRTEAMTVVDVNTGKFIGSGGNLEETVTKNNIEAAEEIVRQLRLRDIGGIIVIDFIDMVLESNRDLVVRRLLECLGRDRTKHQVAEVTSLGLVQMTRKRVGSGLIEVFSESCEHCNGRGIIVHSEPVEKSSNGSPGTSGSTGGSSNGSGATASRSRGRRAPTEAPTEVERRPTGPTAAQIAAAAHAAAVKRAGESSEVAPESTEPVVDDGGSQDAPVDVVREIADQDLEAITAAPAPDPVPVPADELEEPVTSAETPDEIPAGTLAETPAETPAQTPARGRRRRGRVVAPAGPPRSGSTDGAAGDLEPTRSGE